MLNNLSFDDFRKIIRESIQKDIMKEYYEDDFDEGPQPGDAEYHYPNPEKMTQGKSQFNSIDWHALYETLVANKEYLETGMVAGNDRYYPINESDLTDSFEGMLSFEDYDQLENNDVIENYKGYPVLGNTAARLDNVQSFEKFVKSIWDIPNSIDNSPSTFRYRNDGGTDGG